MPVSTGWDRGVCVRLDDALLPLTLVLVDTPFMAPKIAAHRIMLNQSSTFVSSAMENVWLMGKRLFLCKYTESQL